MVIKDLNDLDILNREKDIIAKNIKEQTEAIKHKLYQRYSFLK